MLITKERSEKLIVESLDNIKCDICNKNILKGKNDEDQVTVASLRLTTSYVDTIKEEGFNSPTKCETSDFCEGCYGKIVKFIKELGGKIPSYYFSGDEEIHDLIKDLFS